MKKIRLLTTLLVAWLLLTGCGCNVKDTEIFNQISLLQWLTLWDYYGSKTIKEVKILENIHLMQWKTVKE